MKGLLGCFGNMRLMAMLDERDWLGREGGGVDVKNRELVIRKVGFS